MSDVSLALAGLSLAIWLYLLLFRGFFWLARLPAPVAPPARWPSVVAVVPARNEAELVGEAVASLLAQDYPGRFSIVVVDDHSEDGTAEIARAMAAALGRSARLTVLGAQALPAGWTGKLWALSEGVRQVEERGDAPELILDDLSGTPFRLWSLRRNALRIMGIARFLKARPDFARL